MHIQTENLKPDDQTNLPQSVKYDESRMPKNLLTKEKTLGKTSKNKMCPHKWLKLGIYRS